jgi:endo-1,4-beta-xylanase
VGPDYIDIAFRTAAEADPQAMLVYNEYGLDYDIRDDETKRVAVLKLLERLKSKGTPIHAFGIQPHLRGDETRFSAKKLKAFLRNVADLDLKIIVTELDVTDK